MASPTFIAKGTFAAASINTVYPSYPVSIQAGDILFLLAVSDQTGGTVGTVNLPVGWTALESGVFKDNIPIDVGSFRLVYKIATGAETGTQEVTRSGSSGLGLGAQMYQFRGTKIQLESSASKVNGNGSATVTWEAVTVASAYRTLISFCAMIGPAALTDPAGWTTMAGNAGAGVALEGYYKLDQSTDGSFTTSGGPSTGWATAQVSIFNIAGRSFIVN